MTLVAAYRKRKLYDLGGGLDPEEALQQQQNKALFNPGSQLSSGIGSVASLGAGIIDGAGKGDPLTGRRSVGATTASSALKGAAMGAQVAGPIGAAAGAVVGTVTGLVSGYKQRKEARQGLERDMQAGLRMDQQRSDAAVSQDPTLIRGVQGSGYFAAGGKMTRHVDQNQKKFQEGKVTAPLAAMYMNGGSARSLSSDSVVLKGRSHGKGGIDLPQFNAEVEDGETAKGDYIFSRRLGFAQQHKPIATAIGKIEGKPATVDRTNALKRLGQREDELRLSQEYIKSQLNLP